MVMSMVHVYPVKFSMEYNENKPGPRRGGEHAVIAAVACQTIGQCV